MRYLIPFLSFALAVNACCDEPTPSPVIVELFTSEGCSSCPPADALLKTLAEKQDVAGAMIIPLGFHVDYWDNLGWKDRFSSPLFTQRQQNYRDAMRLRSMYTPQMIVNGSQQFLGSDQPAARVSIEAAAQAKQPVLTVTLKRTADENGTRVDVTVATQHPLPGDLYIVVTEAGLTTEIRNGENAGKKLPHAPVVRTLQKVGAFSKASASATLALQKDWKLDQISIVAFVQHSDDMKIIASGMASLK